MPVPYRKTPKPATALAAAYVDVYWLSESRSFVGALLIIDDRGQPLEFVHNRLTVPTGFLWPERQVRDLGVETLCRSLFDACKRDPQLLVCRASLGSVEFLRTNICPSIPFALATPPAGDVAAGWRWINARPDPAMPASRLADELCGRGFAFEPFERIQVGLRECYPGEKWNVPDD